MTLEQRIKNMFADPSWATLDGDAREAAIRRLVERAVQYQDNAAIRSAGRVVADRHAR